MRPIQYVLMAGWTLALIHSATPSSAQLIYPSTRKVNQVDNYFGVSVPDPYRWLENDTSADTKAWVQTEKQFTEAYLAKIPFRDQIRNRYKQILNYPKNFGASKVGDYIFFSSNNGLQNQSVYYIQKGLLGEPKVFLDPNTFSSDGSVSVELDGPSNDKEYIAYHINKGGSDWQTLHVIRISTGEQLSDEINWIKFGGASWYKHGFFYSHYDEPAAGSALTAKNEHQKIYYHHLGSAQSQDSLVFEDREHPDHYIFSQVTEDEHFLIITESPGTDGTAVYYMDLTEPHGKIRLLLPGYQYNYYAINNEGGQLIFDTNDGASNNRVIAVDPRHPQKEHWKVLIPEKPEKLESCSSGGGKLFATYLRNAVTDMYQYDARGKLEKRVKLPAAGSASGIGGYRQDKYTFYDFSSFTYPPSIVRYDIATGQSTFFKKSKATINTDDYLTEQVFYTSKDGTRVPMFLVHKKGIKLDGSHPTLLYAYGGFNISSTPYFSNTAFILLEQNGVYAIANIRGGGEFGEKWHRSGELLQKQNCFDDFIAAAKWLIDQKYCTKDLLAINGGSNGGLLIGAVMTQRPDLFRVALPEVGVMDMLRFQKFTVGGGWAVEYGSSDSAKYFPYLYKYSPLHNIRDGVAYPATLVFTADHDDRVVPAHSFKFAATLQAKQQGPNPVLIRIDTDQGHGASGSSLSKTIEEQTDKWSFMFYNIGITPAYP